MPKPIDPTCGYVKGLDRDGVLRDLAERYELDADTLIAYANEDSLPGWRGSGELMGSPWAHELQIVYALIRHEKPKLVYEFGTYNAISTLHMAKALEANGRAGRIISVDVVPTERVIEERLGALAKRVTTVLETAYTYKPKACDFCFEDANHRADLVENIARKMQSALAPGGFCVHHDSAHYTIAPGVTNGLKAAGLDYVNYEVLPYGNADTHTGLAFWRNG